MESFQMLVAFVGLLFAMLAYMHMIYAAETGRGVMVTIVVAPRDAVRDAFRDAMCLCLMYKISATVWHVLLAQVLLTHQASLARDASAKNV